MLPEIVIEEQLDWHEVTVALAINYDQLLSRHLTSNPFISN